MSTAEHKGHPTGLFVLFGAEAWERFSYYGMRALLVLYLTSKLHFPRPRALEIYGLYTGLVYLTPLAGGYLADKFLGRRKAVLIGGTVMALGHLAMAFESLLFVALGLLIVGNGFFKPNISTMVGGLYKEGDARRDGAFTIFYMGINLGAFWSPIVCGMLGEKVSWHVGFSAAAVGMAAGLAQFIWGERHLGSVGLPPGRGSDTGAGTNGLVKRDYVDVAIGTVASCVLVVGVLQGWGHLAPLWANVPSFVERGLGFGGLVVVFWLLFRGSNRAEAAQLAVIVILCAFNIFFWMGFEQAGGTMTLFAESQTQRTIGAVGMAIVAAMVGACGYNFWLSTRHESSGRSLWLSLTGMFASATIAGLGYAIYLAVVSKTVEIPASQFQAVNPLLIVALAPRFSRMWEQLDEGRFRTSTPTKMALGMVILGLGFVVLYAGQQLAGPQGKVNAVWLVTVYAIHTVGELCLSPIGLSMVTKLAPARVSSLAMGLWLGSSAIANYLAGTLEHRLEVYHVPLYGFLVVSSIGPALLLMAMTPLLKKWMHGKA